MTSTAVAFVADDACAWCKGPIPKTARRDSICCSVRCRQARHRFTTAVGQASRSAGEPLRLAYADPPYPGRAARYYGDHPDFLGEVDHGLLIAQLSAYDGWALSTSADTLQQVLALCPAGVRIAAWHRGERPTRSARPLNAWEPVIYFGGRAVVGDPRDASSSRAVVEDLSDASRSTAAEHDASPTAESDAYPPGWDDASLADERDASSCARGDASRSAAARRLDSLVYPARARRTDPSRVVGAKPAVFCRWVFDLLGARAGDEFEDLFPGSGGVARAWESYVRTVRTSVVT